MNAGVEGLCLVPGRRALFSQSFWLHLGPCSCWSMLIVTKLLKPSSLLSFTYLFTLKICLFIYKQTVAVFRHTRRGHHCPAQPKLFIWRQSLQSWPWTYIWGPHKPWPLFSLYIHKPLSMCIYVNHLCAWCPWRPERVSDPWNWNYR